MDKTKVWLVVLVVLVSVSFVAVLSSGNGDVPIRVDGNEEFASLADEEGWEGDGSAGDPWIIEGVVIDASEQGYGVYIGNVTDHFVVRGCHIHNATGRIEQYFENSGIYIYNSENGTVVDNVVVDNMWHGIYIVDSHDINVSSNDIEGNLMMETVDHGVSVFNSDNVTVYDNQIGWHDGTGVDIEGSDDCEVDGNWFEENSFGVYLESSSHNEVHNNVFLKNGWGVYIEEMDENEEEEYEPSQFNMIHHNDFIRNGHPAWDSYGIEGENQWDDGETGNYWSDYRRLYPDAEENGVWDTPYHILGTGVDDRSVDRYPVVEPMWYEEEDADEPAGTHPVWWVVFGLIVLLILLRAAFWVRAKVGVKVER
ncbi:MAG: right-handed parallel beta-helix repeat-containing protein [Thermoplasmatota archaeon]